LNTKACLDSKYVLPWFWQKLFFRTLGVSTKSVSFEFLSNSLWFQTCIALVRLNYFVNYVNWNDYEGFEQQQQWRPNRKWFNIINVWSTKMANRASSTFVSNCCSIIRIPTSNKTLFFSRLAAEKWVPHSHETLLNNNINKYFLIFNLAILIKFTFK